MKHRICPPINSIVLCLLVSLISVRVAVAQDQNTDQLEAVRRGLAYVEGKSLTWLHDRKCASCHHLPFMVWVQRDARARGLAIDEEGYQEAVEHLLAADNRAGIVPKPDEQERAGNAYSLMAVFTTLAFREGGREPDPASQEILNKAVEHLVARQEADGSWSAFEGRPPFRELQETSTLLAAYAVGQQPAGTTTADSGRSKVRDWLTANSKTELQQALNLRILIDHERQASIEELLKRQNTDGGWSQAKDMASDAFATGQALYALVSRGGLATDHPAMVRARDFLLTTQMPDGSWTMTSRSQHSDTSQTSAGNLEPITVSGSAWATLGLLRCLPEAGIHAGTPPQDRVLRK